MRVTLGINAYLQRTQQKRIPVVWDSQTSMNGHIMIMGGSGAGKTHTARQLLNGMVQANKTNRKAQALYSKLRAMGQHNSPDRLKSDPDLEKLKLAAIEAYTQAIQAIGTGRELDDLLRYDSREVLRSVSERFDNLNATGIFRPETPPFDPNAAIWRYDIKSLREDEQKLLVYFRLEELFQHAVANGIQSDIQQVVFLDEAKRFFTDEAENPINSIATEGRKFGLALLCASQSPTHFSEDFLANVATKILLRLDEMYWDGSVKKLKIDMNTLKYIVPKKTLAVQIKTSDAASARFIGVELESALDRPTPLPASAEIRRAG